MCVFLAVVCSVCNKNNKSDNLPCRMERRYSALKTCFTIDFFSLSLSREEEAEEEQSEEEVEEEAAEEEEEEDSEEEVENEDVCAQCREDGKLILCDVCPRSYHLHCARPPLKKVPKGKWMCQVCVGGGRAGKIQFGRPSGASKPKESSTKKGERKRESVCVTFLGICDFPEDTTFQFCWSNLFFHALVDYQKILFSKGVHFSNHPESYLMLLEV